jgi:energy-coupling factor transporter ATP-binding protein EcfA2
LILLPVCLVIRRPWFVSSCLVLLRRQYLFERGELALVVVHIGCGRRLVTHGLAGVVLELEGDGAAFCLSLLPGPYPRAPARPQEGAAVCLSDLAADGRQADFQAALRAQKQLHVIQKRVGVIFVPLHQLLNGTVSGASRF